VVVVVTRGRGALPFFPPPQAASAHVATTTQMQRVTRLVMGLSLACGRW
jgi:hypothetical protein